MKISLKRWIINLQKDFMDILHYPVGGVGSVCAILHEPTAQICLRCSGSLKHTIFYFSLFFSFPRVWPLRHSLVILATSPLSEPLCGCLSCSVCRRVIHFSPLFIQTSLRSSLSRCDDNYARVHFRLFGTKENCQK